MKPSYPVLDVVLSLWWRDSTFLILAHVYMYPPRQ